MGKSKDAWSKLSMKERANFIRAGVSEGLKSIDSIRQFYNEFTSIQEQD